jgi:hypothetical protein
MILYFLRRSNVRLDDLDRLQTCATGSTISTNI